MNFDGMTDAERYLVAAGATLLIWGAWIALQNLALWLYARTHNGENHHGN